jgi:hypothetical protein
MQQNIRELRRNMFKPLMDSQWTPERHEVSYTAEGGNFVLHDRYFRWDDGSAPARNNKSEP